LDLAESDAQSVQALLPDLGFPKKNIVFLRAQEATVDNIRRVLFDDRTLKQERDGRLLIYMACHGVACDYPELHGHLLVHDSELLGRWPTPSNPNLATSPHRSIVMATFLAEVNALAPKHKLILLDACFSGLVSRRVRSIAREERRDLISHVSEPVTQVLTAGRSTQEAIEEKNLKHGVFTYHLLQALKGAADTNRRGWFTFQDLASYITTEVPRTSSGRQSPVDLRHSGEGNFVFVWNEELARHGGGAPSIEVLPSPAWAGAGTEASIRSKVLRKHPISGVHYVRVPAGSFQMGRVEGDDQARREEGPSHHVEITSAFWISESPITAKQYAMYLTAFQRSDRGVRGRVHNSPYGEKGMDFGRDRATGDLPMILSWDEAAAYCASACGRLPTEAEWEYAARGDEKNRIFPIGWAPGEAEDIHARPNAPKHCPAVGRSHPNGFGLRDLTGVVRQWCSDFYAPDYYSAPQSRVADPQGPRLGRLKVVRGGSYLSVPARHRLSARDGLDSRLTEKFNDVGFRCLIPEENFPAE